MAAKLSGGDDDIIVDINITPFVDIVLVVLIIFMVTATYMLEPSIKVNLPEAATGDSTENSSLGLMLTQEGELFLNGEPVTEDQLREVIRGERGSDKEVVCLIAADSEVPHGEVVSLIDLVKQEGVSRFAIQIEPEQKKGSEQRREAP